jgi:soluble lytic murein transglycosylase-like protein
MKWLILALAFAANIAHADECVSQAAIRYGVNEDLLWAIGKVESSHNPDAVGPSLPDGNVALGRYQINTIHLPELARYGIKRSDLHDKCKSAFLGAWALSRCIKSKGFRWAAVGCYVAGPASTNVSAQADYIAKLRSAYQKRLLTRSAASTAPRAKPTDRPAVVERMRPSGRMVVWNANE